MNIFQRIMNLQNHVYIEGLSKGWARPMDLIEQTIEGLLVKFQMHIVTNPKTLPLNELECNINEYLQISKKIIK